MKKVIYFSLIIIYLFPNICFGKSDDEPQISFRIVKILGVPSTEFITYYDSNYNNEEPPSWCTKAICIGFTVMGIGYIIGEVGTQLSEIPKEISCGCCTGIILGVIFAYLVPWDKVSNWF